MWDLNCDFLESQTEVAPFRRWVVAVRIDFVSIFILKDTITATSYMKIIKSGLLFIYRLTNFNTRCVDKASI